MSKCHLYVENLTWQCFIGFTYSWKMLWILHRMSHIALLELIRSVSLIFLHTRIISKNFLTSVSMTVYRTSGKICLWVGLSITSLSDKSVRQRAFCGNHRDYIWDVHHVFIQFNCQFFRKLLDLAELCGGEGQATKIYFGLGNLFLVLQIGTSI